MHRLELPRFSKGILLCTKILDEPIDECESALCIPLSSQCTDSDVADVSSKNLWLVGLVHETTMNAWSGQPFEPLLQGPRDQAFVEALEQTFVTIRHPRQLARPSAANAPHQSYAR